MKWIFFELILLLFNVLSFAFNWKAQHYGAACLNMFAIGAIFSLLVFMIKEEILDD